MAENETAESPDRAQGNNAVAADAAATASTTAAGVDAAEQHELDPQAEEKPYAYPVRIEDAGPASKKVVVEIPQDRIAAKLDEQFNELRQQASLPGFRRGHAPRKLIERRFNSDVREEVRRALIRESYEQAIEQNSLEVIGEPEFADAEKIQLPDSGPLSYSFQVEVQPAIQLPPLNGLRIRRPKLEVTDENVRQALKNLRQQQGTLVPVEDRGAQEDDHLTADVHVRVEGSEVAHEHDAQVVARPGRIAGIQLDDLAQRLAGMRPGETRTFSVNVPPTYANEQLRGKDAEVEFHLKDIKRLEPIEVNQEFLDSLGFANEQELVDALREQLRDRIDADVKQAMREQVNRYLLDNVNIELPNKLSDRQEQRIVNRRAVELMLRGTPREEIEANLERLRSDARDAAVRELKLFFILQKVAQEQNVDVGESELNGHVAMLAAQRGRRPEKVKQEMAKDGTLSNLYVQMREQKAIDRIVAQAQIEDVDVDAFHKDVAQQPQQQLEQQQDNAQPSA